MAFEGYLIRIGGVDTFFNQFIEASSYKVTRKILDVDSYRDANGTLHRNTLEHNSYVIEFQLQPMNNLEFEAFFQPIRNSFSVAAERKVSVTFWCPELNEYRTQDFYIPDIDFVINNLEYVIINYDNITIKFIGY